MNTKKLLEDLMLANFEECLRKIFEEGLIEDPEMLQLLTRPLYLMFKAGMETTMDVVNMEHSTVPLIFTRPENN